MTRETMPAGAILALAAAGLLAVGIREHDVLVLGVGCLAASALVVNIVWGMRLGVRARLAVPARAVAGQNVPVLVRVAPDGRHGLPATTVTVHLPGCLDTLPPTPDPGSRPTPDAGADKDARARHGALAVPALADGDEQWLTLGRVLHARGPAGRARAVGVTTAPFGLIRHTWTVEVDTDLLVWPALRPPRPLPGGGPDGERRPAGVDRHGMLPHGVREYRPGDDRRHVHWRSSARRGELVVTERERRYADDAVVLVICPPRRARNDPLAPAAFAEWEETVAQAAWSLADVAARGSRVVLAAAGCGDAGARPAMHPHDVLDWFARLPAAVEPDTGSGWWARAVPRPQEEPRAFVPTTPPDLSVAVSGLMDLTRRGEQVLVLTGGTQPTEAISLAGSAIAAAGRRPLALGAWLR